MRQLNTSKEVYDQLSEQDRGNVAAACFGRGAFDGDGNIACDCKDWRPRRYPPCQEEYLCEEMGAIILMPSSVFDGVAELDDETLALTFDCEQWVVRFRRALYSSQQDTSQ